MTHRGFEPKPLHGVEPKPLLCPRNVYIGTSGIVAIACGVLAFVLFAPPKSAPVTNQAASVSTVTAAPEVSYMPGSTVRATDIQQRIIQGLNSTVTDRATARSTATAKATSTVTATPTATPGPTVTATATATVNQLVTQPASTVTQTTTVTSTATVTVTDSGAGQGGGPSSPPHT